MQERKQVRELFTPGCQNSSRRCYVTKRNGWRRAANQRPVAPPPPIVIRRSAFATLFFGLERLYRHSLSRSGEASEATRRSTASTPYWLPPIPDLGGELIKRQAHPLQAKRGFSARIWASTRVPPPRGSLALKEEGEALTRSEHLSGYKWCRATHVGQSKKTWVVIKKLFNRSLPTSLVLCCTSACLCVCCAVEL